MSQFIRSIIAADETIAADGVVTYPMPVGAMSHLVLMIRAINVTDEALLTDLAALVTKIEVLHRGAAVFSMSAADAFIYQSIFTGQLPLTENNIATDNATRALPIVIPFSRRQLNPLEGLPARPAGTYTLQLTCDIATAEADGLIIQAIAVEMPEATPARWMKSQTMNFTPPATGDRMLDLSRQGLLAGIFAWATTVPTAIAWTATINQTTLLVNNLARYFQTLPWLQLHTMLGQRVASAADAPLTDTLLKNYGLLDLSPSGEDDWLLDTTQTSEVKLLINAGDTSAARIIPIELIVPEALRI